MASKVQVATIMRAKQAGNFGSNNESICGHGNDRKTCEQCWRAKPMSFWEEVLSRRDIESGRQILLLQARLKALETPWYKPLTKRYWKQALADTRKAYMDEKSA